MIMVCKERFFIGLDLSVRAAAAVVVNQDGKVVDHGLWGWELPRDASVKKKIERLVYIANGIVKMCRSVETRHVRVADVIEIAIEQYAFGASGKQNDLGEIQGTVKSQLWLALGLIPTMIVASSARKRVLGKGRFSKGRKGKKEIIKAVCERGFKVSDDNIADAYVIAECLRLQNKEIDNGGKEESKES